MHFIRPFRTSNRRLRRAAALALISLLPVSANLSATAAFAGPPWKVSDGFSMDWDNLKVQAQPLAKNLFLLHGSGGNTLASVGPEGTLLVDTEFAKAAPKLKLALNDLGAGPVKYVIGTHYHPDHMGGDAAFRADGATSISQANCRGRLLEEQFSYFWNRKSTPIALADAPSLTFDRELTLHMNDEVVDLIHQDQPAHTDCDTIVYFRNANVVHMGDIYLNGLYPYIDIAAKGTIDGYFPVIDAVLKQTDDKTQVVPGHGNLATRRELVQYRTMLQTVRDRVAEKIAKGATLEDIIAAQPTREFDDEWASDRVGPEGFVAMVYQSLTGKRFDWQPPKP
ncbi:MBL fold metallo-hydrolase (plasmid) [Phyllobacterium sp. 628]|uniref:MBL fold metallo-hydrolase n=1 Tax=Phyllobacterium sp. 628 TaxID=2718938 RepID=UPI0016623ACC|nr:MBL fold metallo-hydrolase [Phyllobacterium sp. 628]QND54362.1 MBL fold metallo-hydrolase [Phyllobacterium sp. 628]